VNQSRRTKVNSTATDSIAPPLVSVIIPCYNQANFLAEAIESVLGQTHKRFEVIVIDDGSADDTYEVATSYESVLCVRQPNSGLSRARNRGIQESAGDCLVFLDADDRLHPDALRLGVLHLTHEPDAAFSYGRCNLVDARGEFLATSYRPIIRGDHYARLLLGNFIPNPGAMMFRRDAIEALGGFSVTLNGAGAEDYDLCLRLTRTYGASGFEDIVADYRQHEASLSRKAILMSDSVHSVLQSQRDHVSSNEIYKEAWKKGMRNWRRRYYSEALVSRARDNARNGRWDLVVRDGFSLLRYNPRILVENVGRKIRTKLLKIS
jgi:glycosyltransferase involved in cell wall biosynthesis